MNMKNHTENICGQIVETVKLPKIRRSQLSPSKRWLVDDMNMIQFGTYKKIFIRNGEPIIDPPPKRTRRYRFGGSTGTRPDANDDYVLKEQIVELLMLMDRIGNGTIKTLEVQNGVPFNMTMEVDDR